MPSLLATDDTMTDQERLAKVEEAVNEGKLWQAEHDGRINAKWERQDDWNREHESDHKIETTRLERLLASLGTRVGVLEKKIIWICAAAAAAGGSAAPMIKFLTG